MIVIVNYFTKHRALMKSITSRTLELGLCPTQSNNIYKSTKKTRNFQYLNFIIL